MTKEDRLLVQIARLCDVILTAFAFLIAYIVRNHLLPIDYRGLIEAPNYRIIILLILIIWYISFQYSNLHIFYFKKNSFGTMLSKVTKAVTGNILFLAFLFYVLRIENVSRLLIGIFYISNIGILVLSRWQFHKIFALLRRRKGLRDTVLLVIGSQESAKDLIRATQSDPEANFRFLGCLDMTSEAVGKEVVEGIKVIGTLEELEDILAAHVVDEVTFVIPLNVILNAEKYFSIAEAVGVQIRVVPQWHLRRFLISRPRFYSMDYEEFFTIPTFVLSATPQNRAALAVKAAFDYLFSGTLLILLAPFLLMIACAIKISSPGPVFFEQVRSGLNGRRFPLYKFRTMVANAESMLPDLLKSNEASGPVFKMKNDPRIIPRLGTFLRKSGLDELPQLINVIRGEMSIVGPRPPIPEEVKKYQPTERRRLTMKPGITCLWQILPRRNEISFDKWMALDLEYIDNWSLWLDFKILCKTMIAVIFGRGR
jgi:exopolysaccharide biosynthesis polyprenyl glycosylphosphotransferase